MKRPFACSKDDVSGHQAEDMALDPAGGYVAASNLQDLTDASLPIFNVERVQLQFSLSSDFVAAQVANNVLVLALSTGRILRIDLDSPADIDGGVVPVPCADGDRELIESLGSSRYRFAQKIRRGWPHPSHVPRPVRVPFDREHHGRGELLSPHAVQTTETAVTVEGCEHREHSMESFATHGIDEGDSRGSLRRQCV